MSGLLKSVIVLGITIIWLNYGAEEPLNGSFKNFFGLNGNEMQSDKQVLENMTLKGMKVSPFLDALQTWKILHFPIICQRLNICIFNWEKKPKNNSIGAIFCTHNKIRSN